jgi:hypothetical protein
MLGRTRENNFDQLLDSSRNWYSRAVTQEFDVTWGSIPYFKAEVPHLQFNRCQTAFLDSDPDDLAIRRRAVMALAGSVLSPDGNQTNELDKWWGLIGVETASPRIADAICTLYDEAPERTFSTEEGMNEAFEEIYKTYDVNLAMQQAYRYAIFVNLVLIMPEWEDQTLRVLTPDYFRVKGKDDRIEELWLVYNDGGAKETQFKVWTRDTCYTMDSKGREIGRKENPFGRIPGTFLKLNKSNDLYGSGITEAAELNAWNNMMGFCATRTGIFQSHGILLAKNLDIRPGTQTGPGYVLSAKNLGGDPSTAPELEFITPNGKFLELETQRDQRVKAFQQNQGLPAYLVDGGTGTPPSGIALTISERGLNKRRKQHVPALLRAEQDLAELLALGVKLTDERPRTLEVDPAEFAVNFGKPESFNEPSEEFKFDLEKTQNGAMSPSAFVARYHGQVMTDEEAAAFIITNKKYFATTNELRATVGGAQALQSLVIAYEAGQVSRDAGIQQAVQVYGFTLQQAELMFVANVTPPAPEVSQIPRPV